MLRVVCAASYRGYNSEYSFNANISHHAAWMAGIPDSVNITSLSIPGTHDTMTSHISSKVFQCQNWNLTVQMEAGLRYFDIRARPKNGALHIYHGKTYTGYSFKEVLLELFAFLDKQPSEMFVLRLKDEILKSHKDPNAFEKAFNHSRFTDPATKGGVAKHLALSGDSSKPLPTLGELRSKILLLQDFKCPKNRLYGVQWAGPQMVLEDKYNVHSQRVLFEKFAAIEDALQAANSDPLDNKKIHLLHTSAAIGVLPIQAAAGTLHGNQAGMNDQTGEWLDRHINDTGSSRTGVVIMDFPGAKIIESVLAWNKHVL